MITPILTYRFAGTSVGSEVPEGVHPKKKRPDVCFGFSSSITPSPILNGKFRFPQKKLTIYICAWKEIITKPVCTASFGPTQSLEFQLKLLSFSRAMCVFVGKPTTEIEIYFRTLVHSHLELVKYFLGKGIPFRRNHQAILRPGPRRDHLGAGIWDLWNESCFCFQEIFEGPYRCWELLPKGSVASTTCWRKKPSLMMKKPTAESSWITKTPMSTYPYPYSSSCIFPLLRTKKRYDFQKRNVMVVF